jgi:hypothetical protein
MRDSIIRSLADLLEMSFARHSGRITAYSDELADKPTGTRSMSPIRGDVKKKSSPSSPRGDRPCGLHPARSQLWRGDVLAAYSGQTRRLAVCTRRFHDAMVIDAFGSGSYASRRVGFSGPTMVLSETLGLQLSLVMREGIG